MGNAFGQEKCQEVPQDFQEIHRTRSSKILRRCDRQIPQPTRGVPLCKRRAPFRPVPCRLQQYILPKGGVPTTGISGLYAMPRNEVLWKTVPKRTLESWMQKTVQE